MKTLTNVIIILFISNCSVASENFDDHVCRIFESGTSKFIGQIFEGELVAGGKSTRWASIQSIDLNGSWHEFGKHLEPASSYFFGDSGAGFKFTSTSHLTLKCSSSGAFKLSDGYPPTIKNFEISGPLCKKLTVSDRDRDMLAGEALRTTFGRGDDKCFLF